MVVPLANPSVPSRLSATIVGFRRTQLKVLCLCGGGAFAVSESFVRYNEVLGDEFGKWRLLA